MFFGGLLQLKIPPAPAQSSPQLGPPPPPPVSEIPLYL